jgi:MYXO-CTERM domain-containing protein
LTPSPTTFTPMPMTGGAGGNAGVGGGDSDDDGGCGCRLGGSAPVRSPVGAAGLLLAVGALLRRRRGRR